MAPELFTKKPEFTFKADIYSVGMIFWEIVTGKIPWETTEPGVIMAFVMTGQREELPPPSDTPQLKSIAKLIEFCWKQNPEERPTINNVIETIEQCRSLKS